MRYACRTLLVVLIIGGMACGGSSTAPSTDPALTISLKDSPYSDAKALLVTFSEVSAHASGGDFSPLAAGHYTQIRLVVASAALYFDNASSSATPCAPTISAPAGRSASVVIPSGDIRLNREFDMATTGTTTNSILLDFDGDQSVKDTGNGTYMMTPVVSIVSVQ
ncbi:MAG: DUF4382 domain-containing protein [Acidobacteria bacterium]|nr:DUF4382 domain-containing protein [Acidobacteriota bacterium]